MKKLHKYLTFLFLVLLSSNGYSQSPRWIWFERYTDGIGKEIKLDNGGDLFVIGKYFEDLIIEDHYYPGFGKNSSDFFVARFNSTPGFQWIETGIGSWATVASDLDVLNDDLFITGIFSDTIIVNGNMYTIDDVNQNYLLKLGKSGNFQWLKMPASAGKEFFSLAHDQVGNLYLGGQGTLIKIDTSENILWTLPYSGESPNVSNVETDHASNIIFSGLFQDSVRITSVNEDTSVFYNEPGTSGSHLTKFDSAGGLIWTKILENLSIVDIVTDKYNNIYFSGCFHDTLLIQQNPNNNQSISFISNGDDDILIAKFSPGGNLTWAKHIGNQFHDHPKALHTGNNALYYSGSYSITVEVGDSVFTSKIPFADEYYQNSYLAKFDLEGNFQWARNLNSPGWAKIYGITTDTHGNVYLTGGIKGDITLDGTYYPYKGDRDFFLARIAENPTGIHSAAEHTKIRIYPNPARDYIHIRIPAHIRIRNIRLYSIEGRLMKTSQTVKRRKNIDVSTLPAGQYLVKIQTDKTQYIKQLVIAR